MKKIFTILSLVFSITASAQTQLSEGNFVIDIYGGIPNWANSILYNNVNNLDDNSEETNRQNYKVNGSMLSYGGRFEYMFADNFGVGVDVNYEVSGFNYDYDKQTGFDGLGNPIYSTYNVDYRAKKTRIMARLNYHFIQNERIDVYSGFAGGYKHVNRLLNSTEQGYNNDGLNGALFPFSLRLAVGTRIYFTENIGAMVELGVLGGGLVQFGLSAKF
jgi:hypothetical protein